MRNDVEAFEEELNSIISICDEKIKRYRALLNEYQMIKGFPRGNQIVYSCLELLEVDLR